MKTIPDDIPVLTLDKSLRTASSIHSSGESTLTSPSTGGVSLGGESMDDKNSEATSVSVHIIHDDEEEDDFVSVQYTEATPLYKAIEDKKWKSVEKFLITDEWDSLWSPSVFCNPMLSVNDGNNASSYARKSKQQTRTWVAKTGDEICRLPLHAAIINKAPLKVIQELVNLYKRSVQLPDSDGNYPLHLAFGLAAIDIPVLLFILKEFPVALNKTNAFDLLPDECGGGNDIGEVVRVCIDATKQSISNELIKRAKPKDDERKLLLDVTSEIMNFKEQLVKKNDDEKLREKVILKRDEMAQAIFDLKNIVKQLEDAEQSLHKLTEEEETKRAGMFRDLLHAQKSIETFTNSKVKGKKSDKFSRGQKAASKRLKKGIMKSFERVVTITSKNRRKSLTSQTYDFEDVDTCEERGLVAISAVDKIVQEETVSVQLEDEKGAVEVGLRKTDES